MKCGPRRSLLQGNPTGDEYDEFFERLASAGQDMHGEARFVSGLKARTVLDAGCGTGRVGRELYRNGIGVVGVDRDESMLKTARRREPRVDWILGDLETVALDRVFDVVLMAGNVMIFLATGSEGRVIANMARHVASGGFLIAGFQLNFSITLQEYDDLANRHGLHLCERWSTWEKDEWRSDGDYAVTVHKRK